jgi:hypothetical protein
VKVLKITGPERGPGRAPFPVIFPLLFILEKDAVSLGKTKKSWLSLADISLIAIWSASC